MIQFFCQKNLVEPTLVEGSPWDFNVEGKASPFTGLAKEKRRIKLLQPVTNWNVYTANRGFASNLRISKDNPVCATRGIVVDYDTVSTVDQVAVYLSQLSESLRPNFIEISLSKKIRLLWLFEREILIPSPEFFGDLMKTFFEKLTIPSLLPGYDAASLKPTEMWTNGGIWYEVKSSPLAWDYCFGVICKVSQKVSLFVEGQVPIETIMEEVERRFPKRWQGTFTLDAIGVRFWDETADNPTGCQVKPDGCLCFTGKVPFMKWDQILGREWVEEKRILNLGRAGEGIFFDGKEYWEFRNNRWESAIRADIMLRLKGRGLSDHCQKGATQSDVERVLDHIQQMNRVSGAAPMINYPRGIVTIKGVRILNIADLCPTLPIPGPTGIPATDFPWLWEFLTGLFPRPELMPLDHFLAWLRRSYRVVLEHKRFMGQAVFLCGPKNNGKTLLCMRIVLPLMGNRMANPIDYMTGETVFNDDLFEAALLAVNDEDSPANEHARTRMLAKLKGLVVNPMHKHHAKFAKRVTIEWTGRIFVTLNDDPGSVGMLMEVSGNTKDKQMFFATQPYVANGGEFPEQELLEAIIERELPFFAHWLLNIYQPPKEIIKGDRMGVRSYFDPKILELAGQQTYSSNLGELIHLWQAKDDFWEDVNNVEWTGSPTELLSYLQTNPLTEGISREWTQAKIAKSLTALAKQEGSNVIFMGDNGRRFKITKQTEKQKELKQ